MSSSNTATGISPASGWRIISRTADAAASRLPTTATRRPLPREPRCQAKIRDWKRIKLMPRVARISPTPSHLGVNHLISSELDRRVDDEQDGGHSRARENDLTSFFESGMTPHAAVQAVDLIADHRHDDDDEHEEFEMPAVGRWSDIAPVEDFGRAVPGHDAGCVEHHEEDLGAYPAGQNWESDVTESTVGLQSLRAPSRPDPPGGLSLRQGRPMPKGGTPLSH